MTDINITSYVSFGENDGECLPLSRCVCGKKFENWDFILGTERGLYRTCQGCGRKMYFENNIQVFEIIGD